MPGKKKLLPQNPALTLESLRSGEATLTSHSVEETYNLLWPYLREPLGEALLQAARFLNKRSGDGLFFLPDSGPIPSLYYIAQGMLAQVLRELQVPDFDGSDEAEDLLRDIHEVNATI